MLADMMFEAGDLQSAKFQFQKLLDIKPGKLNDLLLYLIIESLTFFVYFFI